MIDWLNDNSGAVQAASAVVLALTLIAVVCYAYQTRNQAKATEQMAEGVLRPVIVQWMARTFPIIEGELAMVVVRYQNIGSGPALNVRWSVTGADVEWLDTPERVGMGVRAQEGKVAMKIMPIGTTPVVAAEYEDVSRARWRSTLQLVQREGQLHNGDTQIQRLNDEGRVI